ncbi:MAG: hypothetical protein K2X47_13185, partial [Bdellovibrionales bacterium]|nr:hypothetical protein [Bdellovibrionales bacterium]
PESGDSIQTMKAGLIEIADVFGVNKADRDGAETLARELENSIELGDTDKKIPVLKLIAREGIGVPELADLIEAAMKNVAWKKERENPVRLRAEAKALLRNKLDQKIDQQTKRLKNTKDFLKLMGL